jgi:hypothetical protein
MFTQSNKTRYSVKAPFFGYLLLVLIWSTRSFATAPCTTSECYASQLAKADDSLVQIQYPPRKAVILIGGINDNYNYFAPWSADLIKVGTVVFGFNHNHHSETMTVAAEHLELQLEKLAGNGFDEVELVAHSMGGLMARQALNILVSKGKAGEFKHLELHAFGTPWGGFALADLVRVMPFNVTISKQLGLPMALEIGSTSPFMTNLAQPWPANMRLFVYQGTHDKIAQCQSWVARERYRKNTDGALMIKYLQDIQHDNYNTVSAAALEHGNPLSLGNNH